MAPFHAALLAAYWSEGQDLHDWGVLDAAAAKAGVDSAEMRAAVEAGQLRAAVDDRVEAAHELGIHAVPTFLIAGRLIVQGAQTGEVFRRAFARLT
jgi:predicted DsbA family dithiol-disulfide isomerase